MPVILDNIKNFEPATAKRRFEQGRQEAQRKEQDGCLGRCEDAGATGDDQEPF